MKRFLIVIFMLVSLTVHSFPDATKEHVDKFQSLVNECVAFQRSPNVILSASRYMHRDCPAFRHLQEICGLESIELIYNLFKRLPNNEAHDYVPIVDLWGCLTHRHCVYKIPWNPSGIVYIWEGGAEFEEEQISFLLKEMRLAAKDGRKQDELVTRQLISCEGIFAFPTLFAELEDGKDDVIEILKLIWRNPKRRPTDMDSKSLLSWWAKNKEQYALPHQSPNFKKTKDIHKWKRTGK